jgi:hypothetical protein
VATTHLKMQQYKDVHFWAWCPWCPENAHAAGFPMVAKCNIEMDWERQTINTQVDVDTQQIKDHVARLHPDKV